MVLHTTHGLLGGGGLAEMEPPRAPPNPLLPRPPQLLPAPRKWTPCELLRTLSFPLPPQLLLGTHSGGFGGLTCVFFSKTQRETKKPPANQTRLALVTGARLFRSLFDWCWARDATSPFGCVDWVS
jgi:hypothetical protein